MVEPGAYYASIGGSPMDINKIKVIELSILRLLDVEAVAEATRIFAFNPRYAFACLGY